MTTCQFSLKLEPWCIPAKIDENDNNHHQDDYFYPAKLRGLKQFQIAEEGGDGEDRGAGDVESAAAAPEDHFLKTILLQDLSDTRLIL